MEMTSAVEIEQLQELCKELIAGADMFTEEPYFIIQPFFGIVLKHSKLISKYNLMDNIKKTVGTPKEVILNDSNLDSPV